MRNILDEDRKINAQKFESAFYANPDLRSVRPRRKPKEPAPATLDLEALVEQLRNFAGTGQHAGRIAGVGPIRKIGRKIVLANRRFLLARSKK